jgi:hypothetical protein
MYLEIKISTGPTPVDIYFGLGRCLNAQLFIIYREPVFVRPNSLRYWYNSRQTFIVSWSTGGIDSSLRVPIITI